MENKGQNVQLADWKKLLNDLFPANPLIYWSDFLLSTALAYGSIVFTERLPLFSVAQVACFFVSVFSLYRAALFIHELTHQERKHLPGFSVAWNLLVGVPTLIPSFMYRGVHIDHHKRTTYSTEEDGEYLPLGASPFWKTALYVAQSFYIPVVLVLRYGVLGPLSLLHPALRRLVMRYGSAMAIRFDVARKIPTGQELVRWYVLELLCFLYVLGMAYLFASGTLALSTLFHIYLVMAVTLFFNSIRTVVAHRYRNQSGQPLSIYDQLVDSVNLEGNPVIGELMAPVGLRFHALHHIFPTLPYHNLGLAHRRLREQLPADSFYHLTVEPGVWAALKAHWRNTQSGTAIDGGPAATRA
jgi:fatty acid desaturase